MMRKWIFGVLFAAVPLLAEAASTLVVRDAWTYAPPPGGRNGAIFATIVNTGSSDDTLLSATTPAARVAELHTMIMNDDGVMRMRHAPKLPVPAQSVVQLASGGNHIMLMGIVPQVYHQPQKGFPLKLVFQNAGEQTVTVQVRTRGTQGQPTEHAH